MTDPKESSNEIKQENLLEGNPYREKVEALIADVPDYNPNQLTGFVAEDIIDRVIKDAQEGKFEKRRKNPETGLTEITLYTVDEIMGQFDSVLRELDMPSPDPDWKLFVTNSNKLRDAVSTLLSNKGLVEPFRFAVYGRQAQLAEAKLEANKPNAELDPSNSELHVKAAEDLGEEAVEAAAPAEAARRLIGEDVNYDDFMNPNIDHVGSVEDAAVRAESEDPLTIQRRADDKKFNEQRNYDWHIKGKN